MSVYKVILIISTIAWCGLSYTSSFYKTFNSPYFYYPLIDASTLFLSIGCTSLLGYWYGYYNGVKNNIPYKVPLPDIISSTTGLSADQKRYLKFIHERNNNIVSSILGITGLSLGSCLLYKNRNYWGGINTFDSSTLLSSNFKSVSCITALGAATAMIMHELYKSYTERSKGFHNKFEDKLCIYHAICNVALCVMYVSYIA